MILKPTPEMSEQAQ